MKELFKSQKIRLSAKLRIVSKINWQMITLIAIQLILNKIWEKAHSQRWWGGASRWFAKSQRQGRSKCWRLYPSLLRELIQAQRWAKPQAQVDHHGYLWRELSLTQMHLLTRIESQKWELNLPLGKWNLLAKKEESRRRIKNLLRWRTPTLRRPHWSLKAILLK